MYRTAAILRPTAFRMALVTLLGFGMGLVGCQTGVREDPPNLTGAKLISYAEPDSTLVPDEVFSRVGGQTKSAKLRVGASSIDFEVDLAKALDTSGMQLLLSRYGMVTTIVPVVQKNDGSLALSTKPVGRDSMARVIVRRLNGVGQTKTLEGAIAAYADALLANEELFRGFPNLVPIGLDTAAVRAKALEKAVKLGKSLTELVATWGLGLTEEQACVLIMAMNPAITKSDSVALFPPSAVRLDQALAIQGTLQPGSRASVSGSLLSINKLSSVEATVLDAGGTPVLAGFGVTLTAPDGSKSSFDLALDGSLAIQIGNVAPGSYILKVTVIDALSNRCVATLGFKVIAGPSATDLEGPTLTLVAPTPGSTVEYTQDSVKVRVVASDKSGVDYVMIDGVRALLVGAEYVRNVALVAGQTNTIAISGWDKIANHSDTTLKVTRQAKSGTAPTAQLKIAFDSTKGAPALRQGTYVTLADSLQLVWNLSGDCQNCQVTIDGLPVALGVTVGSKVALPLGVSPHVVVVAAAGVTVAKDSISVRRFGKPSVVRTAPKSDTLDNAATAIDVVWTVRGATAVSIDGADQVLSAAQFIKHLTSLKPGANSTRLAILDSLGKPDTLVVMLYKVPRVDLLLVLDRDADTLWDSATATITSLTPGVVLNWSTDSLVWKPVGATGQVAIVKSGRIFARGVAASLLSAVAVSKPLTVRHANSAPSYKRLVTDTTRVLEDAKSYRALWAGTISMGGVWDSAQTGSFAVSALGTSATLFTVLPAIDASTGVLTFTVKPDANGLAKFRVVLHDNGGIEKWGTDSSKIDTLVIAIASVNDAPTLETPLRVLSYRILGAPESTSGPSISATESNQTVTVKINPINEQAKNCFAQGPVLTKGVYGGWNYEFTTNTTCSGGQAQFRLLVRDNGGTLNGGVDTVAALLSIDLVDTIHDAAGDVYHFRKLGTNLWMLENLGSTCPTCPVEGKAHSAPDASVCPAGWRLPTPAEWSSLVTEAAAGGKTDSAGAYHLRSVTGWEFTGTLEPSYSFNGDNSTRFNMVPAYHLDWRYSFSSASQYWTSDADKPFATFLETFNFEGLNDRGGAMENAMIRCVQ